MFRGRTAPAPLSKRAGGPGRSGSPRAAAPPRPAPATRGGRMEPAIRTSRESVPTARPVPARERVRIGFPCRRRYRVWTGETPCSKPPPRASPRRTSAGCSSAAPDPRPAPWAGQPDPRGPGSAPARGRDVPAGTCGRRCARVPAQWAGSAPAPPDLSGGRPRGLAACSAAGAACQRRWPVPGVGPGTRPTVAAVHVDRGATSERGRLRFRSTRPAPPRGMPSPAARPAGDPPGSADHRWTGRSAPDGAVLAPPCLPP